MERLYEYLDDLSLEELINLKKTVDVDAVPVIDAIIYRKSCSNTYIHNYDKKNKEENKLRVKQKINKNHRRESRMNRRR